MASEFADISEILCESSLECRLFTLENSLIPFGSGHLTREEAQFLGAHLAKYFSENLVKAPTRSVPRESNCARFREVGWTSFSVCN